MKTTRWLLLSRYLQTTGGVLRNMNINPFRNIIACFLLVTCLVFNGCDLKSNPTHSASPESKEQPQTIDVHITRTGKKYHQAGCRYLSHSDRTVTLEEARAMGLTPCSVCNPPD